MPPRPMTPSTCRGRTARGRRARSAGRGSRRRPRRASASVPGLAGMRAGPRRGDGRRIRRRASGTRGVAAHVTPPAAAAGELVEGAPAGHAALEVRGQFRLLGLRQPLVEQRPEPLRFAAKRSRVRHRLVLPWCRRSLASRCARSPAAAGPSPGSWPRRRPRRTCPAPRPPPAPPGPRRRSARRPPRSGRGPRPRTRPAAQSNSRRRYSSSNSADSAPAGRGLPRRAVPRPRCRRSLAGDAAVRRGSRPSGCGRSGRASPGTTRGAGSGSYRGIAARPPGGPPGRGPRRRRPASP